MKSLSPKIVVVMAVAALFSAAIIIRSFARARIIPDQSTSQVLYSNPGQDGTTSLVPADDSATFPLIEEVDKASVEANPTVRDDTDTSPPPPFYTIQTPLPGGFDHIANGVGTRNLGSGCIRLRGAPASAVAVRAWLYWGTIINVQQPPATDTARFNGVKVIGNLMGTCNPPCWPGTHFVAYKASVIRQLSAGINGNYDVDIATGPNSKGQDPWTTPTPANPLSEGASLLVVYADKSVPTTAKVYFNEAAHLFSGPIVIGNDVFPNVPNYTSLKHTRIGADGQVGASTFAITPISTETTFLGPDVNHLTQIRGCPGGINPDSDWNGTDGGPLNQLWDTHSDSFGTQIIPPTSQTYVVKYVAHGDCIVAIAHILGVK
jgi:hypothetical protein